MFIEFVLFDMNYIKKHMRSDIVEDEWSSQERGRSYFDKEGREIYIFDWGFVVTKNNDGERTRLFRSDHQDIPIGSPLTVAYFEYAMQNIEEFVEYYENV